MIVRASTEIIVYLHIAKTGGTSLTGAIERSRDWDRVDYWSAREPINHTCDCGDAKCREHELRFLLSEEQRNSLTPAGRLFVTCGHLTYAQAREIADSFGQPERTVSLIATVRPSRERIISAFRDYLEQVALAAHPRRSRLRQRLGPSFLDIRHLRQALKGYAADARHYIQPDGTIDGRAWFSAFDEFRGGVTFFLSDIFDSPRSLARLIDTGAVTVVPIGEVSDLAVTLTGNVAQRERASGPMTPQARAAIDEAQEIIDAMVERERPFDDVLRARLGDRFR